jgi:uncharacterized protein YkwD
MAAAEGHSQDMAANNFFSHTGSDGSSPGDRISRQGYSWTTYAENIGAGYTSPAAVVQGWMNSSGHRDNILNSNVQHVGVGFVYYPSSDWVYYWTAVFAAGG